MGGIPYGRQQITEADIQAVSEVLRSDFLTQGPAIEAFETAFAEYVGAPHAIAVANGTAALHLCVLALGLQPGERVITTPITFAASANCVRYAGGEVWFADVDPATGLLDPSEVRKLLKAHPKGFFKGIIPVDYAGHPADLRAFRQLANEYDLWLIEDACHAPGGAIVEGNKEIRCGSGQLTELAIFSFHPVKHIACGEGGMVTTANAELAEKIRLLRTHGITKDPVRMGQNPGGWYYEMQELGYNYRLSDMQAALGNSQLQRADEGLDRRHEIAERYDEAFEDMDDIAPLEVAENIAHAYHLYVVQTTRRKELYDYLRSQEIYAQVHYIPVHQLPYYQGNPTTPERLPCAEAFYGGCLSLPMFPSLTDEEQERVIASVLAFHN